MQMIYRSADALRDGNDAHGRGRLIEGARQLRDFCTAELDARGDGSAGRISAQAARLLCVAHEHVGNQRWGVALVCLDRARRLGATRPALYGMQDVAARMEGQARAFGATAVPPAPKLPALRMPLQPRQAAANRRHVSNTSLAPSSVRRNVEAQIQSTVEAFFSRF